MVLPSAGLVYLDSSALVKLLLPEPESGALVAYLRERGPLSSESPRLVRGDSRDLGGGGRATTAQGMMTSSALARVEVGRAVRAASDDAELAVRVGRLIDSLALVPVSADILRAAEVVAPSGLRSLGAIHLASARSLGDDLGAMVVYDERLAAAARTAGLAAVAPL